jgi:hypothetical protein
VLVHRIDQALTLQPRGCVALALAIVAKDGIERLIGGATTTSAGPMTGVLFDRASRLVNSDVFRVREF